jgi:hypothetical protein
MVSAVEEKLDRRSQRWRDGAVGRRDVLVRGWMSNSVALKPGCPFTFSR